MNDATRITRLICGCNNLAQESWRLSSIVFTNNAQHCDYACIQRTASQWKCAQSIDSTSPFNSAASARGLHWQNNCFYASLCQYKLLNNILSNSVFSVHSGESHITKAYHKTLSSPRSYSTSTRVIYQLTTVSFLLVSFRGNTNKISKTIIAFCN